MVGLNPVLTAPPKGNIPDGIKELTLQTVSIPNGAPTRDWGGELVRAVVRALIGDLLIHFSQCHRGCKRKKAKGSEWEEL